MNCDQYCAYQQNLPETEQHSDNKKSDDFVAIKLNKSVLRKLVRAGHLRAADIEPDKEAKKLIHETILQCIVCKEQQTTQN